MIDIFIVEEMLLQLDQNSTFIKRLTNRLKIECSKSKRDHIINEMALALETNLEIKEMLVLEFDQGITTEQLLLAIKP